MKKWCYSTIVLMVMLAGCAVLSMNNPFDDFRTVATTTTISYIIAFDANGGDGQMSVVTAVNDETVDIIEEN